jgi:RimJ/RimL family protein N-acetyltransferase
MLMVLSRAREQAVHFGRPEHFCGRKVKRQLRPPVMKNANVYLRAFEPDDYKKINTWRRNEDLYRLTTGNRYFVSAEKDRQWVLDKTLHNDTELYLAICLRADDLFIGYVSLSGIDYRNRRAEWSGILIAESEHRGRGYATDAVYLLLEYAFEELGMHRVSGLWLPENKVSVFVGKMSGFRQEGVLRDYVYKNGRHHDVIVMSVLRPEFEEFKKRYHD